MTLAMKSYGTQTLRIGGNPVIEGAHPHGVRQRSLWKASPPGVVRASDGIF